MDDLDLLATTAWLKKSLGGQNINYSVRIPISSLRY